MSAYFDALCAAMKLVSDYPRSVFVGQSVRYPGTAMFNTLRDVPMEKRIEVPVFEDTQLGMCTGMALNGDLPVSIFPRWNFLLCATNQLVNHLDKLPLMGGYRPKVIIRTAIATDEPLDPGPQHLGDFTEAFARVLRTVRLVRLDSAGEVLPAYREALDGAESVLIVERMELYN